MSATNFNDSLTPKQHEILQVMPKNWPNPDELTIFEITQMMQPERGWFFCLIFGRNEHFTPFNEIFDLKKKGYLASRWVDSHDPYLIERGIPLKKYRLTDEARRILQTSNKSTSTIS